MARFEGSHTATLTLDAPLATARAHFADLAQVIACSGDVEQAEVEGDTIHFLLTEQDHQIVKFQGRYSCRYQADDAGVSWQTVGEGNTDQSGHARLTAIDDAHTQLDYSETVAIEMDVPAMIAPMLKPVIGAVLSHELDGYLGRMVAALQA